MIHSLVYGQSGLGRLGRPIGPALAFDDTPTTVIDNGTNLPTWYVAPETVKQPINTALPPVTNVVSPTPAPTPVATPIVASPSTPVLPGIVQKQTNMVNDSPTVSATTSSPDSAAGASSLVSSDSLVSTIKTDAQAVQQKINDNRKTALIAAAVLAVAVGGYVVLKKKKKN